MDTGHDSLDTVRPAGPASPVAPLAHESEWVFNAERSRFLQAAVVRFLLSFFFLQPCTNASSEPRIDFWERFTCIVHKNKTK